MASNRETPHDIYQRLMAQGTPEDEIEEVYRRLRRAGYGEAAAKRRSSTAGPRRRMEDWFPEVKPRLRRQINKWAYQEKLLITGFRERWGQAKALPHGESLLVQPCNDSGRALRDLAHLARTIGGPSGKRTRGERRAAPTRSVRVRVPLALLALR